MSYTTHFLFEWEKVTVPFLYDCGFIAVIVANTKVDRYQP